MRGVTVSMCNCFTTALAAINAGASPIPCPWSACAGTLGGSEIGSDNETSSLKGSLTRLKPQGSVCMPLTLSRICSTIKIEVNEPRLTIVLCEQLEYEW